MAFKRPAYTKTGTGKNDVRVRNSYYTFSKEYPVGNIGKQKRSLRQRKSKKRYFKIIAAVLAFLFLSSASYFAVEVALKFSYKEPSTVVSPSKKDEEVQSSSLLSDGMKALYFPAEKLNSQKFLKDFQKQIKRKNANSVVIDFKLNDGKLLYSSSIDCAILAKCAMFDNETVREAVSLFKSNKINVVARIHCFEDNLIASSVSDYAIKYMNSDVTWLDSSEEGTGRAWLNPFSKGAQKYIRSVIDEVLQFGVDAVMLNSVCFPNSDNSDSAGYPGQYSESGKNACLISFIASVKALLPNDKLLLVEETATDILMGNEKLYQGNIAKSAADGICADTSTKPDGYIVDKKTQFSSMISLFSNMKQSLNENSTIVPIINTDEFSHRYVRTCAKNGYTSYILYNEEGYY